MSLPCRLCVAAMLYFSTPGQAAAQAAESAFPSLPDEPAVQAVRESAAAAPEQGIPLRGDLNLRLHYAPLSQQRAYPFKRTKAGVSSLRLALRLERDFPVGATAEGRLSGRVVREAANLDANPRSEAYIDEAFVDFQLAKGWRLKLGRQLAALGMSEYFQLLDVVNPRDERILGLADLREDRLPVLATRLGYQHNRSGIEMVLKHEFRSHRYADPQSDFDPYIAAGGLNRTMSNAVPDLQRHPDMVLRWYSSEPWGDLQLVAARVYDPAPVPVDFDNGRLVLGYQRTSVFGLAGSYVSGNWVFKSELSHRNATRQMRSDILQQQSAGNPRPIVSEVVPLTEWMVGTRYSGFPGLIVDAEILTQRIERDLGDLADPRVRHAGVVNLMWTGYRDKLRLELLLGRWWGGSRLLRGLASYDLDDRWQINAGYLQYTGGSANAPLAPFNNNDRVIVGLRYSL